MIVGVFTVGAASVAFITTVEMPVLVQPFAVDVPVTVYVVVIAGDADTVAPEEISKPDVGDQLYVSAPVAVITTEPPAQTASCEGVTLMTGAVRTVIAELADAVQPFTSVPVTVYVIEEEGLAVTDVPIDELSPVTGDQV